MATATKTAKVHPHPLKPGEDDDAIDKLYDQAISTGQPFNSNLVYSEEADVENGQWILVIRTIPVDKKVAPKLYGIYWGMPKEDRFGRQCCRVHTTEDVTLLNHEYKVLTEDKFNMYKEMGYQLHESSDTTMNEMDLKLLEEGRALCEEERDIIRALMLDGLTETQACEEYFLSRHTDRDNANIWYYPNPELLEEIESVFGKTYVGP